MGRMLIITYATLTESSSVRITSGTLPHRVFSNKWFINSVLLNVAPGSSGRSKIQYFSYSNVSLATETGIDE